MSTSIYRGMKTNIGSFEGSIKDVEEMLEFYREKDLNSTIEVVNINFVNKTFKWMEKICSLMQLISENNTTKRNQRIHYKKLR